MPEAEDVLLEAAERATHLVRAAWERHRGARDPRHSVHATARRLAHWQTAWVGSSWPVACAAPRRAPGRLARRLRRLPPWAGAEGAAPFTDGRQIWLPRRWLDGSETDEHGAAALLATLGFARRLWRGALALPPPATRLEAHVRWIAEAALGDAALARAWRGLGAELEAVRREAAGKRPPIARLHPVEHALETWLRRLLAIAPERPPAELLGDLEPDATPAEVAAFAERRAASFDRGSRRYRGFAPVLHWGVPHPLAEGPTGRSESRAERRDGRAPPGARLSRPLERRPGDPGGEDRPGPFVIPFGDPQLTVEDAGGRVRPTDRGHDEDLETLAEEISRLDGLQVVRDDAPVREILEDGGGEVARAAPAALEASGDPAWLYPEWDAANDAYRRPGCRVRELPAPHDDGRWAERTLHARRALLVSLRRQLDALRPRRERLRRQLDGDELDLSGWVDDWADLRAARMPSGRLYSREQTRRRDVAVTLLLDASGSTDSWLSGRQRVVDVVKEAALLFGEALGNLGDRFSLLSFSGQSAADVRVWVLKRFEETPGALVRQRIGALEPDAYTRLGGAVRHATAALARERARARLLLVLTDGKPQDEDGYDGTYGVEDVRQAVAEARLQAVRVFGITVDRQGSAYLPRLFGPHGYTVIWNAEALPERLPAVYRRLTAGV